MKLLVEVAEVLVMEIVLVIVVVVVVVVVVFLVAVVYSIDVVAGVRKGRINAINFLINHSIMK